MWLACQIVVHNQKLSSQSTFLAVTSDKTKSGTEPLGTARLVIGSMAKLLINFNKGSFDCRHMDGVLIGYFWWLMALSVKNFVLFHYLPDVAEEDDQRRPNSLAR